MAYQVLARELSFQPVDLDNPTVPTGEEEKVQRGGLVPKYASSFLINALSNAGLIVPVADPDPAIRPVSEEPAAALPNPEQPPPPGTQIGALGATTTTGAPVQVVKPGAGDSKAEWEAYAVQIGVPQAEAESMTKAKLIVRVGEQEAKSAPAPTEDSKGTSGQ